MEREPSISSDQIPTPRYYHSVLPPWEVRNMAQVPYMQPGSPPLARKDQQSVVAAQVVSKANQRPRLSSTTSAPSRGEYSSPRKHTSSKPWMTDAHLPASTFSVEPTYEPPASRSITRGRPACEDLSQSRPTSCTARSRPPPIHEPQALPTPPDRASRSSFRSASAPLPTRFDKKALPGTMSSGTIHIRPISRTKSNVAGRKPRIGRHQAKENQVGLGKRFKNAFRDLFKNDPVDNHQFEPISDRHWTEDY